VAPLFFFVPSPSLVISSILCYRSSCYFAYPPPPHDPVTPSYSRSPADDLPVFSLGVGLSPSGPTSRQVISRWARCRGLNLPDLFPEDLGLLFLFGTSCLTALSSPQVQDKFKPFHSPACAKRGPFLSFPGLPFSRLTMRECPECCRPPMVVVWPDQRVATLRECGRRKGPDFSFPSPPL